MSLKNEKYKNKLENGRKKKFGKEFAEIPKGKRYVEEISGTGCESGRAGI